MAKYRLFPRSAPDSMELHGDNAPILAFIQNNDFGGELKEVSKALVNDLQTHWLEYVLTSNLKDNRKPDAQYFSG